MIVKLKSPNTKDKSLRKGAFFKRKIKKMAYCTKPFKKQDSEISFPCGKCLDCRKRRASSWGFRLSEQLKVSDTAYFLTLTYDSDHVPITKKGRTTLDWGYYPISKKTGKPSKTLSTDIQRFFKMIRYKQANSDIKYYMAAEYGSTHHMRPHYHVIIFNLQLSTIIDLQEARRALLLPQQHLNGKYQFTSPLWGRGHITLGTVTHASVMYTLKYLSKNKRVPQYKYDDRRPEYSLISKGIGENYLSPQMERWHKDDPKERMYVNFQHYKVAMPRYYKERLYSQSEREEIAIHIIEKQHQKRIKERKGTKLSDRIKYIRQINVIKKDKDRKLNKKSQFRNNVL